jgi:glycerol-3-phosphate dehydrogenase (NAD+)
VCCSEFSGCRDEAFGKILKDLFQASYFRMTVVPDVETVELCGALKVQISHFEMNVVTY